MKFQLFLLAVVFLAALALVECHTESAGTGGNICWSAGDCSEGEEYCKRNVGDCNGRGYCEAFPSGCGAQTVCGCNGMNYSSECDAAQSDVSVAHEGEC